MCSYYNSYYGTTYHSDGSTSYYNDYYGSTYNSDGSTSYYNDYYGSTYNSDGSTSYYNDYYGSTYNSDGSSSYYNGYYGSGYHGGSSSYYSSNDEGGCYITTACVKAKGFSDDCFELTILRKYRDLLIKQNAHIKKLVEEYYVFAPKLVAALNRQPNKQEIYMEIYDSLVVKSISYLIEGDIPQAVANYKTEYKKLWKRYCC